MAELLIKAISASHADPDIDIAGCYKKGDIVVVMDDDHGWGGQEGLPTFVIVKCPGLSRSTIEDRRDEWIQLIDYALVQHNLALDGARFRLFATIPGAANQYGLTLAKVQAWLDSWGGVYVSSAINEVRFDITVQNAYKSAAFWGGSPVSLGLVITETGYSQATGLHTATVNLSGSSVTPAQVKKAVESHGGTVVSYANQIGTFTIQRDVVVAAFMNDMKAKTNKTLVRRRYVFAPSDVDTAINAGGIITVTQAQLAAKVIDKTLA